MLTRCRRRRRRAGPARPGGRAPRRTPSAVGRIGPPCLPGIARVPATPRSSSAPQLGALAGADRADQQVELAAHLGEQPEHGRRVAGDDLLPQRRVAGGDPGDVADALARECEVVGRRVGEPAGHQHGEQVRQVRGAGHRPVVLLGREPHRHRAAQPRQRLDQRHRAGRGRRVRRDRPGAAVEQGGGGGQRAGALAARHRVAADVPLDAGDARDRASGPVLMLPTSVTTAPPASAARDHRAEVVGRHRDHDQLRARRSGVRGRPAPRPEAVRTFSGETSVSSTSRPGAAAGQRDRGAEQPGADDLDRPDQGVRRVSGARHSSSGTERTRVRSLRRAAAPCR